MEENNKPKINPIVIKELEKTIVVLEKTIVVLEKLIIVNVTTIVDASKIFEISSDLASFILRKFRKIRNENIYKIQGVSLEQTLINILDKKINSLISITDFVPSKKIRKKQKKLIADEFSEITEFAKKGEARKVHWRLFWVRIHWIWYLVSHPVVSTAFKLAKKYISK